MIAAALLLLQAATTVAPSTPERFSVLAPQCAPGDEPSDIVVCAAADTPRLPLPDERGPPDHPVPGNPDMNGTGALAMEAPPCATVQAGCTVGVNVFGPPVMLVRVIQKLVNPRSDCCAPGEATDPIALARDGYNGVKAMVAKKRDTSNRIAIPLDDPPITPPQP